MGDIEVILMNLFNVFIRFEFDVGNEKFAK